MSPHAEGVRHDGGGTFTCPAAGHSQARCGIHVQQVVSVAGPHGDAVGGGEIQWIAGAVLIHTRSQGHLVVLDDEHRRNPPRCRQGEAFVERPRPRGSVTHPGHGDAGLLPRLERQRDTGDDGGRRSHMTHGLEHSPLEVTDVEIAPTRGRVGRGQVSAEQVRERHAHHVEGAGVADHGDHQVAAAVEGRHASHGHGLLSGAQPCFGDHPGPNPSLQSDIVQTSPDEVPME